MKKKQLKLHIKYNIKFYHSISIKKMIGRILLLTTLFITRVSL
jgi:hypothetical protein